MESARRNNTCDPLNVYEQQRNANIAIVDAKLKSLNIPRLTKELKDQPKKRKKRTHTVVTETEAHNLRPRPPRNLVENATEEIDEDLDCEPTGDFLCPNEDVPRKKRGGRGITRMEEVFARTPHMAKVKVDLNEFDQPVGSRAREPASVIGCLVRKISVQCSDWRLVDIKKKDALWKEIKAKYDIHADGKHWVLKTAGYIWKDFKATLKKMYFDKKITDEQLKKMYGDRVNDSDWEYLVAHWMSPEFEVRTKTAKANRAKLAIHHTSGTKSFARARHELGHLLQRPPRRDEVYIKTHTRKNGVPTKNAEPIINKLKEIVEACPELKERTIEQGDALAAACGAKEPRGRVRALGLGPTPQDIGVAGLKCYQSTRFQMECYQLTATYTGLKCYQLTATYTLVAINL
ncbi:uncharacterized protein LOC110436181 isoform X3 [Sorghum bicolor]|nr:uncharacterized protein LOC110436181 isoform X3 [Sorghum bicolor]|eukprot:XP_021318236.1 uncharacterized protein LOC110436181 isoform X3 [Sorghum bicolor]